MAELVKVIVTVIPIIVPEDSHVELVILSFLMGPHVNLIPIALPDSVIQALYVVGIVLVMELHACEMAVIIITMLLTYYYYYYYYCYYYY